MSQMQEKIELLSAENHRLSKENAKLRASNASLAADRERLALRVLEGDRELDRACDAAAERLEERHA